MPLPVEQKYIEECENELGAKFPDAYRIGMSEDNGGDLDLDEGWEIYPIKNNKDRITMSRTANHVVLETYNDRKIPSFPKNGVSIAHDGMGNRLVLLIEESEIKNLVYMWNHENGELMKFKKSIEELFNSKV